MADDLERGRQAFARQAWGDAYALLSSVSASLAADDLERLAVAAHLVGRDADSGRAWESAHREHTRLGDVEGAARCAFWLGLALVLRGEMSPGGGWLARADRLLDDPLPDSATKGLLLVPTFLGVLGRGDHNTAFALSVEMIDRARRCGDGDLAAMGVLCRGEALLASGDIQGGLTSLDEAMVTVTAGEVSPITAGIVYCAVIDSCMRACDLRRAAEWTDALDGWCSAQPDLVPYRGQCLVHRSQVLLAHGAWTEAMSEAEHARRRLSDPAHPALGMALYQQGELHRLRGAYAEAERAYRAANEEGRDPAPGFALLRLAQGNVAAAAATVRRMVDESRGRLDRPPILAAAVDIFLASGEADRARQPAEELTQVATRADMPVLHAMAAYASGVVLLADGDASHAAAALVALRRACAIWRDLAMPYDSARARVQIAIACRMLGDDDGAMLELDAARTTFERLEAAPEVARVMSLIGETPTTARRASEAGAGVLSDREREVLRLVATGKTNRDIATDLVISEHTVARHLQNIFMKLGLSSRAAATAYAYERGIV